MLPTNISLAPTLSWGTSSGAVSYEYCYDTVNDSACAGSWTSTGASTSVGLSGLTTSTTYYWQVRAVNPGGTTAADVGTWWSFSTVPPAPGAFSKSNPTNLATNVSLAPTLSWAGSSGAASYEYCYDTVSNTLCEGTWISTGASTSVGLSGLIPSTTYYWQVRAINPGGTTEANTSSWWSFSTVPPAPGVFSKTAPVDTLTNVSLTPALSWAGSSGATFYEYCYDTNNNNICDATWTSTGSTTNAVLSGLVTSTTYYWQVRATNSGGVTTANGDLWWSFTTVPAAPAAFNKTSPSSGSTNISLSPSLSWGTSSGAASYEYCYDTVNDSACGSSWVTTGTNTSVVLGSLTTSTTYYWQVRAINTGGTTEANSGSWWSFSTVPPPPAAFSKTSPASGSINASLAPTLSWGTSSGAVSYEYCYDTVSNTPCEGSWISTGAGTSVGLSGLTTSTTYYWQVRAVNPGGSTESNGGIMVVLHHRAPRAGSIQQDQPRQCGNQRLPGAHALLGRQRRRSLLRVLLRHGQ